MKETLISIDAETGDLSFVHDNRVGEALQDVGGITKTRATHIEPVNRVLRGLFYLIRDRVDDSSWLAGATRLMPCLWQARLVGTGEIISTGRDRLTIIQEEVDYLNERI